MKDRVYLIACAACGFIASSLNEDLAKASFCDHLRYSHPPLPPPDTTVELTPRT